jgi:hypothetical protein
MDELGEEVVWKSATGQDARFVVIYPDNNKWYQRWLRRHRPYLMEIRPDGS